MFFIYHKNGSFIIASGRSFLTSISVVYFVIGLCQHSVSTFLKNFQHCPPPSSSLLSSSFSPLITMMLPWCFIHFLHRNGLLRVCSAQACVWGSIVVVSSMVSGLRHFLILHDFHHTDLQTSATQSAAEHADLTCDTLTLYGIILTYQSLLWWVFTYLLLREMFDFIVHNFGLVCCLSLM